jgi:hypothetical protein
MVLVRASKRGEESSPAKYRVASMSVREDGGEGEVLSGQLPLRRGRGSMALLVSGEGNASARKEESLEEKRTKEGVEHREFVVTQTLRGPGSRA